MFAGFFSVMNRVKMVTMRDMRVMAGFLVARGAVVFRRVAMMLGGGLVVLGSLIVMLGQHAFVHDLFLLCRGRHARAGIGHPADDAQPVGSMTVG
jgi:hypothetical protein